MEGRMLDLAIMRAWPAPDHCSIGPWLARLDAGVTRRANCVLPLGEGPAPASAAIDAWLDETVAVYTARELIPYVQVTTAAWPAGLATEIASRGWETGIDRTLLLAGPVPVQADGRGKVALDESATNDWIATWWQVDPRGVGEQELEAALAIVGRISEPVAFARVVDAGGLCVGTALGVLVDRMLVLECVATLPEARRSGVARTAITALGRWATARGAALTVLAVQERNVAAGALYESLGLKERGAYAYARPVGGVAQLRSAAAPPHGARVRRSGCHRRSAPSYSACT